MGHDPSKVLMGASPSSERELSCENGDPATFLAGLAVRRASSGDLVLADNGTTTLIGISAGASLSDTKKTAVFRSGLRVPVRLKDESTYASIKKGDITFTAKLFGAAGNVITVTLADTETGDVAVVDVDGYDITIGIEGGVTTAETIGDALDASEEASALIEYAIDPGDESAAQAAAAQDSLEGGDDGVDHVVPGGVLKIDDTLGTASSDGDTTNGIYSSGVLTGVYTDGTTARVALVDIPGGL